MCLLGDASALCYVASEGFTRVWHSLRSLDASARQAPH